MAEKLQASVGVKAELIAGSGGVFDVKVNDELAYSKAATGTFPDEDALCKEIAEKYN